MSISGSGTRPSRSGPPPLLTWQCDRLLPGIQEGWDLVEAAALAEGLIW